MVFYKIFIKYLIYINLVLYILQTCSSVLFFNFYSNPTVCDVTHSTVNLQQSYPVAYPGILFGGGGSTNSVEDRENGDLGAVAP
jgi:hypothetical protein